MQVLQKNKIIMLKTVICVLLEVLMLVRVVILSNSEDSIAPNSFQEECSMCPNQTFTQISYSIDLAIEISDNLNQNDSWYRLDYNPPVGFPSPNTTIAATEIGDVIKFKGLTGTRYDYWLYYNNSTLHDWLTWTFSITTPPDSPSNLTVSVPNGTTAIVYWSPPVQGNYSGFLLRTQSFNDIRNLKTKVISVDSVPYTFRDLTPGATYSLQLFTVLDTKKSIAYISSNFTTKPNTPTEFSVWFSNETTLLVKCQPPFFARIYTHYKVSIDPPDTIESVLYVKPEEFGVAEAIFKGLVPGRAYNISVQTVSQDETSAPITVQYHTVPLPPFNVTFDKSSVTSTSFRMFWNPPNGTSEFDMYEISLDSNRKLAPIRRNRHEKNRWEFKNLEPGKTYEVVVRTVSGNIVSSSATGNVTLKPLPVYDLRAIDKETGLVEVFWTPKSSSTQDSYKLQYREVETTIGGDSNTLTTNKTKVTLSLLQGGNYSIIVQAISNKVESNETVIYQATYPACPVINYINQFEKGLDISWKNNINYKHAKYEVIYQRVDILESANTWITKLNNIVLRDLYPGALYKIKIFAFSHGLRSKPQVFIIGVPPHPPQNLSIEEITNNIIVMSWEAPTDSRVSRYLVRYRTQDDHSWIEFLDIYATEVKVDMTPGERYIIQVNSVSEAYLSLHSLQMNYTIRPNPVLNINSYQIINSTNVILEWLRPKGRIEAYFIRWWPIKNPKDIRMKNVSESNDISFNENAVQIREVLVHNLMPEEQYFFVVHTVSYGLIGDIRNITTRIKYIPEYISSKPTSLRAFVEFHNGFISKTDISVTFRWNQPEFTHDLIQGYTVKYWFIKNQEMIPICNKKSIPATKLENTVQNLTSNTTYYFRVRAHTKVGVSPYTDLNVSTTHENPIPQLLTVSNDSIDIWDLDSKINKTTIPVQNVLEVAYSIAEYKIYWIDITRNLMTWEMNENNITEIARLQNSAHNLCIDWVARNLYWMEFDIELYTSVIMKLDLTMWQNGIVKFDKIKITTNFRELTVLPFIGIVYWNLYGSNLMHLDFDGKATQLSHKNASICFCPLDVSTLSTRHFSMTIDDMNIEKPLIYWTSMNYVIVTDINICRCNIILNATNINYITSFKRLTFDKTNIYISSFDNDDIYVLRKKYAHLESVNAFKYIQKIKISYSITGFYAFSQSLQSYPPTRCLTPKEKVCNIKVMEVMTNSIIVNFTEPVRKNGCEKYNLPTTLYTIHISHCLDNGLNKFKKFKVQTYERHYEIQNLTPLTEYELQLKLSNFYVDQLSMNPILGSDDTLFIRTKPGKLNAPENLTVQTLTSTIVAVQWMPPKKLNCVPVTYEVHWWSVILIDGLPYTGEQVIKMPKYTADGMFFTKIQLLFAYEYLIYVRVYPVNFSEFYNDSSSKTIRTYLEPNNITLSGVSINSMNISWIASTNLTVLCALKYKNDSTENWQTTNNIKGNYNEKVTFYIKNLQPETSYQFRLILRYLEYEENITWPSDERFTFSTLGDDISSTATAFAVIVIVVVLICVCCFYYLYRQRNEGNEQVLPSLMTNVELAILHEIPSGNIQFNALYNPMLQYNSDEYTLIKIKREQITLTKLLGSGAFGMVFQGNVKNLENPGMEMPAAIKMLREDASLQEKKKFLQEARLMNRFQHEHVLRLLGVCLDEDSPLLVLELMEIGDLLKYLRENRKLQPSDSHALRLQDLLAMCEDIARGCCYLEELRFVHRDLACRNCLVSARDRENRVVKIGDFGLARDVYKDDYYRKDGRGLLPVRWMAPESLVIGIFTSQSDVWSFGVLMWEITSLGEQPYTGRTNVEVVDYVRTGGRLPMSLNCPSELFQLMMHCWNAENARPNFKLCLENIIALRKDVEDALLSLVDIT